jgi:transposase
MLVANPWTLLAARDAEIARLQAELERLRRELHEVRAALEGANGRLSVLTVSVGELMGAIAKGNDRIAELLAIAQRKKSKPTPAEKPPPPPPELDDEGRARFEERPIPPQPPGPLVDHPRPKQRPTGRKSLPPHLAVDESTVHPERCACCGANDFDFVDEVVEEKLDIRAHQRRRVTRRKTGRCKQCNTRTTAEAPPSPFARSKVTCEWLAWLITQKFQLVVPLDRVRRYLGVQGLALSMSFLVTQIEAAADILEAIDGENWKELLGGTWMATDGTGLKVQVPGVGLHHGFLEVYHRDDLVVFHYEAEKGGETQAAKLKNFKGTLLVDAEARYNETLRQNPGIAEANCNAHPRRKLRDAEKAQPVLAVEAGHYVSAMFAEEAVARERGLSGMELLAWRQERIGPLTLDFRTWMEAVEPTLIPGDPLAKVIRYYRNHWRELMRFLDDPACIPLDNSSSEREFQLVAKLRLNSLFAGSTEGAHRAAVLLGIAATCRRIGVDLEAYLTWVFVRRGTHADKYGMKAAELTPAAYKRAMSTPS